MTSRLPEPTPEQLRIAFSLLWRPNAGWPATLDLMPPDHPQLRCVRGLARYVGRPGPTADAGRPRHNLPTGPHLYVPPTPAGPRHAAVQAQTQAEAQRAQRQAALGTWRRVMAPEAMHVGKRAAANDMEA